MTDGARSLLSWAGRPVMALAVAVAIIGAAFLFTVVLNRPPGADAAVPEWLSAGAGTELTVGLLTERASSAGYHPDHFYSPLVIRADTQRESLQLR